ncbi:MAG TPA: phosphatase PAP2 family protein [Acidimicrobiales bacterium]|nr:phosphatase PAP2 family protein [Acidimicrobiales bacterium]
MAPTSTESPRVRAPARSDDPRSDDPRSDATGPADVELVVACLLLMPVVVAGMYLMARPGPTLLDHWAFAVIPTRPHARLLAAVTRMASPPVVLAGVAAGFLAVVRRDRARGVAVVAGPALAVVTSDWVMKPLVGRTFGGVLCFPSGTVVVVAALAAVAVLAAPARWRYGAGVVGGALVAMTALAVVALGWHYPTDALAGAATGVGVVLAADCAAHRVAARLRYGALGAPDTGAAGPEVGRPPRH